MKLLATYMEQSCGIGEGGTGWSEEKRETTHAEQVSGRELFAGSLWYESYPCTCYMRLSPLVQSHINTDDPVTLTIAKENRTSSLDP